MTTQTVYRFLCDGPACPVQGFGEKRTDVPDGWRVLSSTAHIEYYESSPYPARRKGKVTWLERQAGEFRLHLCPDHAAAFDAHLPNTDGCQATRGGDSAAWVGCSCGIPRDYTRVASVVGRKPSLTTEYLWWRHLPAELRGYARRNAGAVSAS